MVWGDLVRQSETLALREYSKERVSINIVHFSPINTAIHRTSYD